VRLSTGAELIQVLVTSASPNPAVERPARKAAQAAHFYVRCRIAELHLTPTNPLRR
jgi:hypothetical protein